MLRERVRSRYPDRNFDDDEALYSQISDDYDQFDQDLSRYKEREGRISQMFASDPRSAAFLASWGNGGDPAVELVRQFGTEIKEAIDDPDRQEAIAEANREFVERVAKSRELDQQYADNLQQSLRVLDEYQEANGLTDEQVDEAMSWLIGIVRDGVMGKFSDESINLAMKGMNYDSDVEIAGHDGEVRGRNAKIDERLRRKEVSDGTPNLAGKNNTAVQGRKELSFFDYADAAK